MRTPVATTTTSYRYLYLSPTYLTTTARSATFVVRWTLTTASHTRYTRQVLGPAVSTPVLARMVVGPVTNKPPPTTLLRRLEEAGACQRHGSLPLPFPLQVMFQVNRPPANGSIACVPRTGRSLSTNFRCDATRHACFVSPHARL